MTYIFMNVLLIVVFGITNISWTILIEGICVHALVLAVMAISSATFYP